MEKARRKAGGIPVFQRPDQTRQYGSIEEIRPDHVKRYLFAASLIPKGSTVLDIACGCGYGSWILHKAGLEVTGVDISGEAISYAEKNYQGPKYICADALEVKGNWDAIVTFETLEHLDRPEILLANLKGKGLVASVPNEEVMPFRAEHFAGDAYPHRRHYTPKEFDELLESTGHKVLRRYSQKDKRGEIEEGTDGMFLIYAST